MLIAFYNFIMNVVIPQILAIAESAINAFMPVVIILGGFVILFSCVGVRISSNLGSTIMQAIFKAIGYIIATTVQAIGWLLRTIFNFIPRVFRWSRNMAQQVGINPVVSNLLAGFVTLVFIAVSI